MTLILLIDLIIVDMLDLDVMLGMPWLPLYHVVLNYNAKTMDLKVPKMGKLESKGVYKLKLVKILSLIRAKKLF